MPRHAQARATLHIVCFARLDTTICGVVRVCRIGYVARMSHVYYIWCGGRVPHTTGGRARMSHIAARALHRKMAWRLQCTLRATSGSGAVRYSNTVRPGPRPILWRGPPMDLPPRTTPITLYYWSTPQPPNIKQQLVPPPPRRQLYFCTITPGVLSVPTVPLPCHIPVPPQYHCGAGT